jgi:hypothetical protein
MKPLSTGVRRLAILFLIPFASSIQAQVTSAATEPAASFSYDVAKQVTVVGTVSRLLLKASPGMIAGSHLLLATPSGVVDASLGRFALQGRGAVSITAGQQIEATGVMRTMNDKSVFLVRTIKVRTIEGEIEVHTVRNEHGFPVSPQARERATKKKGQDGESL